MANLEESEIWNSDLSLSNLVQARVEGAIIQVSSTHQSVHPAFLVPFPSNKKFVGRDDDLERLHAALISGVTIGVRPAMLSGMGGIGKTQLAVEYAYRHRNDYSGGVYWINAAQDWGVELTRLAEQIGFNSEEENENRRREALSNLFVHFIQKTPETGIIFDNVEDCIIRSMSHSKLGKKKRWEIHIIGYPACHHNEEAGHDPGAIILAQDTRSSETKT